MIKVLNKFGDSTLDTVSQKLLTEKFNSWRDKIYDYIPKVSKNEFLDIPLSLKQGDSFLITVSYPNTVPVFITLMKDAHTYKDVLYNTNQLYLITNDTDFDVTKIRLTIIGDYVIDDETIAQVHISQDANSIGIANSLADISGKCYNYIPKVSKKEFLDIPLSLKQGDSFLITVSYPNTVPVFITLMKDAHTYKDVLYNTNQLYLITNDTDFDVTKIRITIDTPYAIDDSTKAKVYITSKGLSLGIIKKQNSDYMSILHKISDIESSDNEEKDRHYKLAKVIRRHNMEEWSNLQFGMFIHWGVYSVYGGSYNGTDVNGNPISTTSEREWLMQHKLIPKNDYMRKGAEFASDKWNPELICALAKSVGMKYIILTVRHHEGFSLYPSEYCAWNISQTKASQDVVMQLKKACEKNGIKFGIYYSYFLNWTEEGGYGQADWNNGIDPYSNEQHTAFVKKQINYVNELNSVFEPYIIWYDNGPAGASEEMQKLFYDNQKMNYPTVIFNNRGCIENGYISDEDTYSESIDASSKRERATGLPAWGYNSTLDVKESTYPKLGDKIFDIVRTISRGYNYLLNIGPDGHGEVPPLTVSWLGKLAKFSREYFTLNGSKGLLWQCNPEWGRIVNKGNTLYLMVHPSFTSIYLDSVYTQNIKGVHIYGVEDSNSNYSIEDDYRIKITNLSPISEYGYSFVRVDLYSEASALDYICIDSSIKPMQLVRTKYSTWKYSGAEWDKYTMNNGSNAVSCRFKWIGDSGEYKLKLDADLTNNQSFKVVISDKSGTILSSNSIGKNEEGETLETTEFVNMTKDDIYTFSLERITNDATSIIRSVQFIRKEL